ncbi:dTDP-4-dehydrorhamnose 3,5-epimerase [Endozoicomonas euniceicola]|uniref:dTDP-4-dehydrorhamnose 3,5-epimerase n=1 Tax=Endozoicomonas euniceicola TaxID=1234143 RepID=A0ABY6GUJ4_9GAMM|nr:dTDP-4-dehydrorhamnose 3,5-epimerase [Endozoicomonas euniceicola]UYM16424.1 dTDP-4-dehydrorhamnose 3,5-epimerase [Endozoicomonas euniceicola]
MKVTNTKIPDVKLIEPKVFSDERGFFLETFQAERYKNVLGEDVYFVQDNHSFSIKGVLRGLHMQEKNPQGKLVRVVAGSILDVAVDLRPDSNWFGQWVSAELSEMNKKQFWIPPGFAHGFVVLSESAGFEYKCTDYYNPSDEIAIRWDDLDLDINWLISNPVVSEKDMNAITFKEYLRSVLK